MDPFRDQIKGWLAEGLSVVRMTELARADPDHPFFGGRSTFSDDVLSVRRELDQAEADVPIRFEGLPGEYLQVDWGEIHNFPFTRSRPPATSWRIVAVEACSSGGPFRALERERDNLRAALTWCWREGRAEPGLRLTTALRWFWYVHHSRENDGPVWLARFLALPDVVVAPDVRVKALAMSLMFDASFASADRAEATLEEFRAFCEQTGDRASLIRNHWWSGRTVLWKGDYPRARALFSEGVALARGAGDRWALALELEGLGWLAQERGENAEARRHYEESLANYRAAQGWRAVVWSLLLLGQTACRQGDFPVARRSLEEAREVGRRLRQKHSLWSVLRSLAEVARNEGDYRSARALLEEGLDLAHDFADPSKVRGTLLAASWLAHQAGEPAHARALLRDVLVDDRGWDWRSDAKVALCVAGILAVEDGAYARGARLFGLVDEHPLWPQTLAPDLRSSFEEANAAARASLGDAGFEAARAGGRTMPPEGALADAMPVE